VSEIIDTPAEGFPLPTMTPPTRTLRDVVAQLTAGGKVRAAQRAGWTPPKWFADEVRSTPALAVTGPDPEVNAFVEGVINEPGAPERITHAAVSGLFDREVGIGRSSVLDGEIARRLSRVPDHVTIPSVARITPTEIGAVWRDRVAREAFANGRAYERGATLRRGASGKSLGSRRVQAQGIATDYLRDDPQDGARLAALVLAGFAGADPETVR
jgi:hypothetical protein